MGFKIVRDGPWKRVWIGGRSGGIGVDGEWELSSTPSWLWRGDVSERPDSCRGYCWPQIVLSV